MARTKVAAQRAKDVEARRRALIAASKNSIFNHSAFLSHFSRGMTAPKIVDGMRVPCKYLPGTVALREIRQYQASTELLIKRLPFQRVVSQILQEKAPNAKIQTEALLALQVAAEAHVVEFLDNVRAAAEHAGRVTIMPRDFALAKRIAEGRP